MLKFNMLSTCFQRIKQACLIEAIMTSGKDFKKHHKRVPVRKFVSSIAGWSLLTQRCTQSTPRVFYVFFTIMYQEKFCMGETRAFDRCHQNSPLGMFNKSSELYNFT